MIFTPLLLWYFWGKASVCNGTTYHGAINLCNGIIYVVALMMDAALLLWLWTIYESGEEKAACAWERATGHTQECTCKEHGNEL